MEWFSWALAAALAVVVIALLVKGRGGPDREALVQLAREAEGEGIASTPRSGEPAEAARIRAAVARTASPAADSTGSDEEVVLRGLFRYLEGAVLTSLRASLSGGGASSAVEDAVHALEDLGFYAREPRSEGVRTENLATLVQSVTREYALETGIPVKFSAPSELLSAEVAPEGFKDALYLLLANAGHFGRGQAIEVTAEALGDRIRLSVGDRGPGFTLEALDRAFEPFWTSESDALGLGLTHARRSLGAQGAVVSIKNRAGGGAEVEVLLRRSRRSG